MLATLVEECRHLSEGLAVCHMTSLDLRLWYAQIHDFSTRVACLLLIRILILTVILIATVLIM